MRPLLEENKVFFFPLKHILMERTNTFAFLFHLRRDCVGAGSPGNYRNQEVADSQADHDTPSRCGSGPDTQRASVL